MPINKPVCGSTTFGQLFTSVSEAIDLIESPTIGNQKLRDDVDSLSDIIVISEQPPSIAPTASQRLYVHASGGVNTVYSSLNGGWYPPIVSVRKLLNLSGTNKLSLPSEVSVSAGESITVYVRVLDTSAPRVLFSGVSDPKSYTYISSGSVICSESSAIYVDGFKTNVFPSDGNIHRVTIEFDKTVYLDRFGLSHTNIFSLTGDIERVILPSGEVFEINDDSPTVTGSLGTQMTLAGGTWNDATITGSQWVVGGVTFFKVDYNVLNEYVMTPICGQSNGVGSNAILTTTPVYQGQAIRYLPNEVNKFGGQKEYLSESCATARAREVVRAAREDGFASTQTYYISEIHAVGGRGYDEIKKGGTEPLAYAQFISDLTAINADKPTTIYSFDLVHGEADLANPWVAYRDNLIQFLTDYTADYKAITGKVNDPVMFVSQIASQQVYRTAALVDEMLSPLALLDVCRQSPKHYSVGPQYWCETNGGVDYYHLNARDQIISGEYRAKAYHEVVTLLNPSAITATIPTSATISGNTVTVTFDVPKPPLQFETDYIPSVANNGFVYSDDSGNAITNVAISGQNQVIITLSGSAGANPDLQYALANGTDGICGIDGGPRGTLCDSETATSVNYPAYVMRNYSLAFRFGNGYLNFS